MRLHLTTLLLLLLSFTAIAGDGKYVKYYSLENLDPMVNQTMEITEPSYNGQDSKVYRNYRGFVFLDYARQDQSDLLIWQTDWRCDVRFDYRDLQGNHQTDGRVSLHFSGGIYEDYQEVFADGSTGLGMSDITITSITREVDLGSGFVDISTVQDPENYFPSDIDFRFEIRAEQVYDLQVLGVTEDLPILSFDVASEEVRWNYLEGAEAYDLEWVFIDKYSQEYQDIATSTGMPNGMESWEYPFYLKDPTRVRVWQTKYEMDMTFPEGTLYFRVRPVSEFVDGLGSAANSMFCSRA